MADLSLLSKGLNRVLGDRQIRLANKTIIRLPLRIIVVLTLFLSLTGAQTAWSGDNKIYFEIPPSTAHQALNLFARQADIQLLYPYDLAEELQLEGLSGKYTVDEGIKELIAGSCLEVDISTQENLVLSTNNRGFWFMKNKNCHKTSGVLAAITTLLAAAPITAQESDSTRRGMLEEIIVVATKREQSIQDVPITMLSFTGDNLQNRGVGNIEDLSIVTPGLFVGNTSASAIIVMRGVGTSATTPGNEPSVATFIDDIYNPYPWANFSSFPDTERVEVLKGPQGTLFGRNATGGVIHIITKDPTHEPEAKVRMGYGSYNTVESSFYGTMGLTENLAGNISLSHRKQNRSYIRNSLPGLSFVPDEERLIRGKLLYTPTDKTLIKLTGQTTYYEGSAGIPRQPMPGFLASTGEGYSGDFYTMAHDLVSYRRIKTKMASLHVTHSLDSMDIVNIVGWRKSDSFSPIENDGTALFNQNATSWFGGEMFTEEFRLVSTGDGSLDWVGGFYYSDFDAGYDPIILIELPGVTLRNYGTQDTKGWAIFGEAAWAATEKLTLISGIRYNKDEQVLNAQAFFNGNPIFAPAKLKDNFEKLTYRIGLQYQLTDGLMLYNTFSRGYKTGLFALVNTSGPPAPAVNPEVVDAIEIGFKSEGWADGRVLINGALFYYDYQDLQVTQNIGNTSVTTNAAAATVFGGELDFAVQITDRLGFSVGLSYLDTEYDEYLGVANRPAPSGLGNIPVNVDFSGNQLARAPKLTTTIAVDYYLPTSIGNFNANLNYYHNDGFFYYPDNNNSMKEQSYDLLNLTLSWTDLTEKYKVGVWGKNITDEKYSSYRNDGVASGYSYVPAEPATFGISAEYSF